MRICLVSRELDPFFGAGIGVYVSAAARAWAAAGHEVHVVTEGHADLREADRDDTNQSEPPAETGVLFARRTSRDPQLPLGARTWNGVVVHVIDSVAREDLSYFHLRHALGVSQRLCALHAAHPFDYIEFADYFAEGAFALHARRRGWGGRRGGRRGGERLPGAVLGVRLHMPSIECWAINDERDLPAESVAMGPLEYRALAAADVLVSPSKALLDRVNVTLGARRLRQPPGHVVPYPFDADAPQFDPGGAIGTGDSPIDDSPTVLCFGRLERRKGVHVLAAAAVELLDGGSPARFVFVGDDTNTGPVQSSMHERVLSLIPERWRERITIESAVPRHVMLDQVRSSTLCCFPAIWDNFPNALLEAMAMGKPIVATSGSGMGEIIEHERSGLLVEPGEVSELAGAIGRALSDELLRERLAIQARSRVQHLCDPARVIGEMEGVIRNTKPSMRRDLRRWSELVPAAESRSVVARARLSLRRRMGRSAR